MLGEFRQAVEKLQRTLVADCTQKQNRNCSVNLFGRDLDQFGRESTNLFRCCPVNLKLWLEA